MVRQYGGEGLEGRKMGGDMAPTPGTGPATGGSPATDAAPPAMSGGPRRRHRRSTKRQSRRRSRGKKGGDAGIISTAAVPFGLLALQRYFKGSKTSKRGMQKMGRSFKRTFRRRR
jgi:hypothetical protein